MEKIYDDAILLGVYETCWMQELHLLSNIIIKKINTHLDYPYIKQIRLKYVQKPEFLVKKPLDCLQNPKISHNLSKKEQAALNQIADPELRQAIEQFLKKVQA